MAKLFFVRSLGGSSVRPVYYNRFSLPSSCLLTRFLSAPSSGWQRLPEGRPFVHSLVGGIVLSFGIMTVFMIPHPLWFIVLAIAVVPSASVAAALLAKQFNCSADAAASR